MIEVTLHPQIVNDSSAGSPVITAAPILSVANPGPYLTDITEFSTPDPVSANTGWNYTN